MSEAEQRPTPPEREPILNLHKFAPKKESEACSEAAPEDSGPTLFIKKAAADTAAHSSKPVVIPGASKGLSSAELLGALSYCYAKGVFGSGEIEKKLAHDPEIRKAVGEALPNAEAIRRFRRMNRQAIRETLEKFYRRQLQDRSGPGTDPAEQPSPPQEREATDSSTTIARRAAENQLDDAIVLDNLGDDD